MLMDKTLLNLQFTAFTLILVSIHSLYKVTKAKSNIFLAKLWSIYIVYSAVSFLLVLGYQVVKMDILKDDIVVFDPIIPEFLQETIEIIGLEDYSELQTIELTLKFLPYVINFSLGVYARRQMITNSEKIKIIEENLDNITESCVTKPISDSESFEEIVFGTRFNFAFCMFKFRKLWWIIDLLCYNFFY